MITINKEAKTKLIVKKVVLTGGMGNLEFTDPKTGEVEVLEVSQILNSFKEKEINLSMTSIDNPEE